MTARISDSLYRRLTSVERSRLAIDACARGDFHEVQRLSDTCPEQRYWSQDPHYTERMKAFLVIALSAANSLWRARLALQPAIGAKELADDLHDTLATHCSEAAAEKLKVSDESAMFDRIYSDRASDLVGVCDGIRRFCDAVGEPPTRFFSLERSCLPVWEFGCDLAKVHPCNETIAEAVYRGLTGCWSAFVPAGSDRPEASVGAA